MPVRMAGDVWTFLSCLVRVCPYLCLVICCPCLFFSSVLYFFPFMLCIHMAGAVCTLVWSVAVHMLCIEFFLWVADFNWLSLPKMDTVPRYDVIGWD